MDEDRIDTAKGRKMKSDVASFIYAVIAALLFASGVLLIVNGEGRKSVQDGQQIKDMQDEIDTLYRHLEECLPPKEGKIND